MLAAAFVLYVYDSILTFPDEYEYVWKAQRCLGKVQFNADILYRANLRSLGTLPDHSVWNDDHDATLDWRFWFMYYQSGRNS
jgi:hypothetical protein